MSRKKGNKLSEISQNLKQTIKQYNELAMDDNVFNDEFKSKSTNNYYSKEHNNNPSHTKNINPDNKINENKSPKNNINNNANNNNNNSERQTLIQINEIDEDINNIEQCQNNFTIQLNTLMNNLNILEENINKDFDELENFIENDIEKELISKQ